MNYGVLINEYQEFDNEYIFKAFDEYFNHPSMTKIKDVENYSMYLKKLYCLLSKECRYIVVFTNSDLNPIGHEEQLISLNWVSFQTRTFDSSIYPQLSSKAPHSYTPRALGSLTAEIVRKEITEEASIYDCEKLGLNIVLLHTDKNTSDVYQSKGNVVSALETFQTIITFV